MAHWPAVRRDIHLLRMDILDDELPFRPHAFRDGRTVFFAMSDFAKILLPIIAAYIGWKKSHRVAWFFAIAISITAALSSLLQDYAQSMKDGQAVTRTIESAQKTAERARRELQAIDEGLTMKALQALADAKKAAANREAERGGCGQNCEALQAEHAALIARLGKAQRRDELQAKLDQANATIAATPEKANGPSDHLATLTGGDKVMIASIFSIVISIAQLVILELLAAFSGDAGATIRNAISAMRRNRPAKRMQRDATAVQPDATPAPKRATKAYYEERLAREFPQFAEKVQRGEMSVFAACVATGLRKAPKKDWTKLQAYGFKDTVSQ